jgi:hypothetical protein
MCWTPNILICFFAYETNMIYPVGTRYPPETRRVWAWVPVFTRGYGYEYENLPVANVLAGGYLLYPTQT